MTGIVKAVTKKLQNQKILSKFLSKIIKPLWALKLLYGANATWDTAWNTYVYLFDRIGVIFLSLYLLTLKGTV